jgi:galactitol-specific phosphotransferase system IIC component
MPVVVVAVTVLSTTLYFKKTEAKFLREGVWLGIVFLVISLAIDLLMFSWGPMAMPLIDYIKDIGFTYLLIPVITIGMGYLLRSKLR